MHQYKRIKLSNGETRDEHRLIIEHVLGRRLERNEVVHHINGNKRDNRINNLELMSLSDHSRIHSTGRRVSEETIQKIRKSLSGRRPVNAKLSKEQVYKVRDLISNGEKNRFISELMNIGLQTVKDIRANKRYKDI